MVVKARVGEEYERGETLLLEYSAGAKTDVEVLKEEGKAVRLRRGENRRG